MRIILIFGFIAAVTCSESNETIGVHRVTHIVWFEITIGNVTLPNRIVFGLFSKVVPITVENFVNLAERPEGQGYKGSKFHDINSDLVVGGKWMRDGNTMIGRSSYDNPEFDDENFTIKHYGAGWVSCDVFHKDGNTSLFIITLMKLTRLDNICVVFAKVISGMPTVWEIARVAMYDGAPAVDVVISDCGAELADPPFFVPRTDATE